MSKRFVSAIFACLLITLSSSQPVQAQSLSTQDSERAILIQLIETLQKQIKFLQAEIVKNNTSLFVSAADIIDVYRINNPSDVSSIENPEHQEYFERVFKIFPSQFDNRIGRLMVFNGDNIEYAAFVETLPPHHDKWSYAISNSMLEDIYSDANTELIIHELAHLVSYEKIPGLANQSNFTCHSYFEKHGCPENNSYLNKFVDSFWSHADLKRAENIDTAKHSHVLASNYYSNNYTKYVSDYAVINPEEDFAETFMFYVLDTPAEGSKASQKIDFMESYPELRLLKKEIINNN